MAADEGLRPFMLGMFAVGLLCFLFPRRISGQMGCPNEETHLSFNTSVTIQSRWYTGSYENNIRCEWTVTPSAMRRVLLRFLKLEEGHGSLNEFLHIGTIRNPRVLTYSGVERTHARIVSPVNEGLQFEFRTDESGRTQGFELLLTDVDDGDYSVCPNGLEIFHESFICYDCPNEKLSLNASVMIQSPGYPADYRDNFICEWTVTPSAMRRVLVQFLDFRLQRGSDFLYVGTINNPRALAYTGFETPLARIISPINEGLLFEFRTNFIGTYEGFSLLGTDVEDGDYTLCQNGLEIEISHESFTCYNCPNQNIQLSLDDTVAIQSPGYPVHYPNDITCEWTVTPSATRRVMVQIIYLQLEDGDDFLYVGTMNNSRALIYTGFLDSRHDARIISPSNEGLLFEFISDGSHSRQGFSLSVTDVEDGDYTLCKNGLEFNRQSFTCNECPNEEIRLSLDASITIRSPGYPADYPNDITYYNLCENGLEISHESFTCFDCPNEETQLSLNASITIRSPGYPSYYPNDIGCVWTVTPSAMRRIQVKFLDFNTQHRYDFLYVGTINQPRTLTYSGRFGTSTSYARIISPINEGLLFEFTTSYSSNSYNGFSILVTDVEDGDYNFCQNGLEIPHESFTCYDCPKEETHLSLNTSITIQSPGYPAYCPVNITCEWTVTPSAMRRVLVHFLDISLQSDEILYVGTRANSRALAYSGYTADVDASIISAINESLLFEITTDKTGYRRGFSLLVTDVEDGDYALCENGLEIIHDSSTCYGSMEDDSFWPPWLWPSSSYYSACNFVCSDGDCIPEAWLCDSIPDCNGNEDEESCTDEYVLTTEEMEASLTTIDEYVLTTEEIEASLTTIDEYVLTTEEIEASLTTIDEYVSITGEIESTSTGIMETVQTRNQEGRTIVASTTETKEANLRTSKGTARVTTREEIKADLTMVQESVTIVATKSGISETDITNTNELGTVAATTRALTTTIIPGCLPFPVPANAVIDLVKGIYAFGDVITVYCRHGFALTGDERLICSNTGVWHGDIPRCSAENQRGCLAFPEPENAVIDLVKDLYAFGDVINVYCRQGFALTGDERETDLFQYRCMAW
ncbi:CUB and sushi domain-containing protein 3-like [Amphiura filiformis]|uniref:CUB and sushi domain-containing protein 3-like n=1 Tax=Amphiura filiformis TaxID=82378 RepID=UPI003B227C48